jgi:AcrR family transcriptional regulator
MEDLARAAGVSRITLHRVFGTRAELIDALRGRGLDVVEPPDARDRILAAATAVFLERGLLRPTVEDVAARAGVGPATVYRHFGSRQGLIEAFSTEVGVRRAARKLAFPVGKDFEAGLARFLAEALRATHATRGVLPSMLEGTAEEPELFAKLRMGPGSLNRSLTAWFAEAARQGHIDATVAPADLASAAMGMVIGFSVLGPGLGHSEYGDPDQVAALLARVLLRGVGT